jgi:lipoprotein-anchoring transpeptidase ErfK/SrfK
MWTYKIASGQMLGAGGQAFVGYSGAGHTLGEGRNNPVMADVAAKGPIPPGRYVIGVPHDSPHTGAYTMDLTPGRGTNTLGRSAFRIHGNNVENDASHGCIVLPPGARRAVWASGDRALEVVP